QGRRQGPVPTADDLAGVRAAGYRSGQAIAGLAQGERDGQRTGDRRDRAARAAATGGDGKTGGPGRVRGVSGRRQGFVGATEGLGRDARGVSESATRSTC